MACQEEKDRKERICDSLQTVGKKYNVELKRRIRKGPPAQRILREARKGHYDMIVMGSHSRLPLLEHVLGGVASQVVHHTLRPVLIVKSLRKMRHMLVCLDGSRYSEDALLFSSQIVRKAQLEVSLLTVMDNEKRGLRILEKGAEILAPSGITPSLHAERGEVTSTILEISRRRECDLIVFASKGTSSVKEFLLGDVASKLMQKTTIPTLIFREKPILQ